MASVSVSILRASVIQRGFSINIQNPRRELQEPSFDLLLDELRVKTQPLSRAVTTLLYTKWKCNRLYQQQGNSVRFDKIKNFHVIISRQRMQEANKQFKAIKNCCNKNIELYRLRGTILKGFFFAVVVRFFLHWKAISSKNKKRRKKICWKSNCSNTYIKDKLNLPFTSLSFLPSLFCYRI